ncbi:hypothetical protein PHISCL_09329 [Aspergillus sclerotialis]|uniref:Uncharacterized protein n=1 Tax=Aspergillus sclerotialis TaxID=2070753 RepID=A0A3A2Z6M2_9EURO|nr:hypothetical protein PHISCL_09329 [Aspergillus sclerotialis]
MHPVDPDGIRSNVRREMTVLRFGFVRRERVKVWPVVVVFVVKSTTAIVEGPWVEQARGLREAGVGVVDTKGRRERAKKGRWLSFIV